MTETKTKTETTPRLGVIPDLDEDLYHSDPTSISASGAKTLLRSPAHFLHERTHGRPGTKAMDLGTVAHELILGTGRGYVAVEGNRNAKVVKEEIAKHEADGKIVLKPDELAAAERMADAVLSHPDASRLIATGRPEVSMFARDEARSTDQHPIIRRCRWDWINDVLGIGVDLKTTRDAALHELPKHVLTYGYDLSAAWYLDIVADLAQDLDAYALVCVESTAPHPVVVAELSGEFLDRGKRLADKALDLYADCLAVGEWPGYLDAGYATLEPPAWAKE